jgi:hypothetical protein
MLIKPEEYDPLTRMDFWIFVQRVFAELNSEPYLDNFHVQVLAARLDKIRLGGIHRLAIALPPRNLKSIIVSVALPAWLLGHDPGTKIICASYAAELSEKLSADCRQVMQSAWYRRLFPNTELADGRQPVRHFHTTKGGSRFATSVGGSVTGLGAHLAIVDDPIKPDEVMSDIERVKANKWLRQSIFTRLDNKKSRGSIIIVMQRLHEDDMIGHVVENADFELLSFPAIAPCDETHAIETPWGCPCGPCGTARSARVHRTLLALLDLEG